MTDDVINEVVARRFIVDAPPEEAPEVLAKMIEVLPHFTCRPSRPGWGWHYTICGKQYFIRETKTGLSASATTS